MLTASIRVMAVLSATAVFSLANTDDDCPSLISVLKHFSSCTESKQSPTLSAMFGKLFSSKTVISKDDLITEINSVCQENGIREKYIKCSEEIISPSCPVPVDYITNNINDRLAVFCDGNQTAAWLLEALQNGFMFKTDCVTENSKIVNTLRNCSTVSLGETDTEGFYETPIDQALPLLQIEQNRYFWCTINRTNAEFEDNEELDCGVRWQDMLLTYWLYRTSVGTFEPVIGQQEIEALQELKSTFEKRSILYQLWRKTK